MGSSNSKVTVSSEPKPELNTCPKSVATRCLVDPRSPSTAVDRTPIQAASRLVDLCPGELTNEGDLLSSDPRSPTVGIVRTPLTDSMRVTFASFPSRLALLFNGDVVDKQPKPLRLKLEEVTVEEEEELGSSEPLLTPPPLCCKVADAALLATPETASLKCVGSSSPFVLVEEAQVHAEDELTVEEAEEAEESPLPTRLRTHDSYALPSVTLELEASVNPAQLSLPALTDSRVETSPEEAAQVPSVAQEVTVVQPPPVSPASVELPVVSSPALNQEVTVVQPPPVSPAAVELPAVSTPALNQEQPQPCTGIRCPTFDPKSPSQVVFKPQWLGKGFGTTGLRARGVQARGTKGGSSPLAVRLVVKNATKENKGQSAKGNQKGNGLSESRSPLQILKATNSPREQHAQVKQNASTPDRQRPGKMSRRVMTVALDQENRG